MKNIIFSLLTLVLLSSSVYAKGVVAKNTELGKAELSYQNAKVKYDKAKSVLEAAEVELQNVKLEALEAAENELKEVKTKVDSLKNSIKSTEEGRDERNKVEEAEVKLKVEPKNKDDIKPKVEPKNKDDVKPKVEPKNKVD